MTDTKALPKPTVVIVPGILHVPAHFDRLTAALKALDYPVLALDLPSIGATAATAPSQADGRAVRDAVSQLVEEGLEVVTLAHSYGGIPASEAVRGLTVSERTSQGKAGGVIEIVYMAAFAVQKDESIIDALERLSGSREGKILEPEANAPTVLRIKPGLSRLFYHDFVKADFDHYTALLQPIAANHADQIVSDPPWTLKVPKTYILCTEDTALPLSFQKAMLEDVKDETWTVESIASGHSPFVNHVGEVVAILERVSKRAAERH